MPDRDHPRLFPPPLPLVEPILPPQQHAKPSDEGVTDAYALTRPRASEGPC